MGFGFPDINGARTSFASLDCGIEGLLITDIQSVNYRDVHEIPKIRGTSARPIGRTRGTVDYEGDITFYQAAWARKVLPIISRAGAFGFAELAFPMTFTYAEMISPLDTVTDWLLGVRIHSPDQAGSEGAEALVVKCTMSIMGIIWNNRYESLRAFR